MDSAQVPHGAAPAGVPTRVSDAGSGGRVGAAAYALAVALSLLLGAAAVVRIAGSLTSVADSDLANFFLKSAAYVVRGDPWHMYAVRAAPPYSTYPNVDPPLSIVLLAPLLKWASALGIAHSLGARVAFVSLPFVLLVPLLGGLAAAALRFARPAILTTPATSARPAILSAPAAPVVPAPLRFLAFALIALGPLAWISCATWGHLEQPLMLCLLVAAIVALQARRVVLAGVLAGLALLAGTAALFPLVALIALLLAGGQRRRAILVGGCAIAVVAVGMAPFLLIDRHDTLYAFVTWRGSEQIGGNSLWSIFTVDAVARVLPHAVGTIIRRLDTPLMLVLAVGVATMAARRLRVSADGPEVWAVLALAALGLPLLAKVVWPYYYLQPFVLLLIYECATLPRYWENRAGPWRLWGWPVLSGGFLLVATTLALYVGLPSAGALDRVGVGLLEFGTMLLVLVGTWRRLCAAA